MNYVIVGASAAGIATAKKLRELRPQDEITLVSKDSRAYSRCLLHKYLEGERTLDEIDIAGPAFPEGLSITWLRGAEAMALVPDEHKLVLTDDEELIYDKLLIAAGAQTAWPPIPGLREAKNAYGFRDLEDIEAIRAALPEAENIFVLGAGLVGIDAVEGLLPYDKTITLADLGPHMLPLQLDEEAARAYQDLFASEGVTQCYGVGAQEFELDAAGRCTAVLLGNSERVPCDLVLNCAGVRANAAWLEGSGVSCERAGIVVDANGRTSVEDVFAAGDVCAMATVWPAAVAGGINAAYAMAGVEGRVIDSFSTKASMHFLGLETLSVGTVSGYGHACEERIERGDFTYRKLVYQGEKLVGLLFQGDLSGSNELACHIAEQRA